jgi:hypothetical protein
MGRVYGAVEAEAEALAEAPTDALTEPDGEDAADGDAEPLADELAAMDGSGLGVGSGNSFVGIPRNATTKIRRKMSATASTHGAASRSLRGGREPR